ncbi:hypothetical protein E1B28_007113 [Marasmius oreades]|uniref:Uncharacterized protein n=1 Tax=Marasmius oreades TaxID=181124 RepID=A0A9P7S127_9AGAR|nr:uncharacterized protein E1B28_007113 [Marasmius oreades]KAG7093434.1 hypothetical protein E1B28_007113 [Marasmius oreades]
MDPNQPSYNLPTETISNIVSFTADDKQSLLGWSLASRTWRGACLPFIFFETKLESFADFRRWNQLIQLSPGIATVVRRVEFCPKSWAVIDPISPRTMSEPIPSIPTMAGVTELDWAPAVSYNGYETTIMSLDIIRFLRAFPSLRKVEISSGFLDVRTLECFLGNCGPIKELRLNAFALKFEPTGDGERNNLNHASSERLDVTSFDLSSLGSLIIDADSKDVGWITTLFVDSKPQRLRALTLIDGLDLLDILPLLNLFAPSVGHLTMKPAMYDIFGSKPLISLFPSLRTLIIETLSTGDAIFRCRSDEHVFTSIEAQNLAVMELKFHSKVPERDVYAMQRYNSRRFYLLLLKKFPKVEKLVIWFELVLYVGQRRRREINAIVKTLFAYFAGKEVEIKWSIENRHVGFDETDSEGETVSDTDDEWVTTDSETSSLGVWDME